MAEVQSFLNAEEPDYKTAAAELGSEALPHLAQIVAKGDLGLASKAAHLAGVIDGDGAAEVLRAAARRREPAVRVAAAWAARLLQGPAASDLLLPLLADEDRGVRKLALQSVPADASAELRAQIAHLSEQEKDASLRELSLETLKKMSQ